MTHAISRRLSTGTRLRLPTRLVNVARLLGVVVTLLVVFVATLFVLPLGGLTMFVLALAVVLALPFAVVAGVVSLLDPAV